jgi:hypothetical protein
MNLYPMMIFMFIILCIYDDDDDDGSISVADYCVDNFYNSKRQNGYSRECIYT